MQALRLALLSSVLLVTTSAYARSHVSHDDEVPGTYTDTTKDNTTKVAIAPSQSTGWSWPFRLEGGIGVRWGSFLINNVDAKNTVKQFHLDGGLRFGENRILVYAQYALQSMQIPLDELAMRTGLPVSIGNGRGLMHRFAAHGRYSFGRAGKQDGGLDLFADVGAGVQHIRWDAGGAWTRPDLQLALGLAAFGMGEKQHGGMTFSVVLTLAPRNDVENAGMACGGPCDYATEPTGVDRSFMFDVTFMFGK
ncbi:MAG: hypothetical protein ACKV2T_33720 [Kofleriaceae bacterium]